MHDVLDWITALPPAVLYLVLACVAAIENVFPPLPADTIVAFGAFLAARGHATLAGAFAATLGGNLLGAMAMYAAGRHFGAAPLDRRLAGRQSARRLASFYARYGGTALFVSRFLPGVRALVPPFAGALRLPAWRVALILGTASAIWYGGITLIAYRVGSDWTALQERIVDWQQGLLVAAAASAVLAIGAWFVVRQRRAA